MDITSTTRLLRLQDMAYPLFLADVIASLPEGVTLPDPATEDDLIPHGYAAVRERAAPPGYEPNEIDPIMSGGVWYQAWGVGPVVIPEPTLQDLKDQLSESVNTQRTDNFAHGVDYLFPSGNTRGIQLRPDDRIVLLGRHLQASQLIMMGAPETELEFRSRENISEMMTAQQSLEMTTFVLGVFEASMKYSWEIKTLIDTATSVEELPELPVSFIVIPTPPAP